MYDTGKIVRMHGHRTDSACCRRTPYLHRLRTASVRLRTVSVRIGTTSTTGFPLSKWSQYGLKRYANGLKRYANGASTASVYSRLSPSYARAYEPFSLCVRSQSLCCTQPMQAYFPLNSCLLASVPPHMLVHDESTNNAHSLKNTYARYVQ